MRIDNRLFAILVTLPLAAGVGAQSLSDAAKRESERRKAAQQKATPVKSYGDQDLPTSAAVEPADEDTATGTTGVSGDSTHSGARTVKPTSAAPESSDSYGNHPGSEASWRAAASAARRRVATAERRVQELDSKAARLLHEQDRPGSTYWQVEQRRTLDALEQAKSALEQARRDQDAMQESARQKGALPGWLRE